MRTCKLCGEEKPDSDFGKGRAQCNRCRSDVEKARYAANRKAKQAYQRDYYYRAVEARRAAARAYAASHKREAIERMRRWKAEHPDRQKANNKRSRARHPETSLRATRNYYQRHREQRVRDAVRWAQTHPHVKRAIDARRRLRGKQAFIEYVDFERVALRDNWTCQICRKVVLRVDATLDHIVPLSQGGEHSYRNVQLAHRRCNSQKNDRGPGQIRLIG